MGCSAPVPFQPGAGSRLCPFCGTINLVREQEIAAPPLELKIDEAFRLYQAGQTRAALERLELLLQGGAENIRLQFYRAAMLLEVGQQEDGIYALVDMTGLDAPAPIRADVQAKLAEALLGANRTEEALQAAERSLELVAGHPAASYQKARALVRLERPDEAQRLIAETQPLLEQPWKITFPPQSFLFPLLQAKVHEQREETALVAQAMEAFLLRESAAPLSAVAMAGRLLGLAYLTTLGDGRPGLSVLEYCAQVDPDNRFQVLDALRSAIERLGGEVEAGFAAFREARNDLLAEVREALLAVLPRGGLSAEQIRPELELGRVDADPDHRVDLLEAAAHRMRLERYDRGTLYPLASLEDFRRWTAAWRLRERIQIVRHAQTELERLQRLRSTREAPPARPSGSLPRAPTPALPARRWPTRLAIGVGLGLALALVFAILAGERFLDSWEGSLVKVECAGENGGPPCSLHVAAGEAGRRRFRARETQAGPGALLSRWLDARVRADGTIEYPLTFPWGNLNPEAYRRCTGRLISKLRFTLAPICHPRHAAR
jgi:tetratricopeptide (TPR) repeat protein